MDLGLKDAKAFVAGASRGLGFATALKLANEGARLAINGRDEQTLQEAANKIAQESGQEVLPLVGDLSKPDVPQALIQQATEALGGLDLLVTNTGGPPPGPFESFKDSDWEQALDLVFYAHLRLIRAALPALKQSARASVLTITSISVKQPVPNLVLSNAGRGATIGMTKTLALELGEAGIRFNSILPSFTETERISQLMGNRAEKNGTSIEQEIERQSAESPLGRMGQPEEFANVAVFLLSPAASYLTGNMLSVDGGTYKGTF